MALGTEPGCDRRRPVKATERLLGRTRHNDVLVDADDAIVHVGLLRDAAQRRCRRTAVSGASTGLIASGAFRFGRNDEHRSIAPVHEALAHGRV